MFEQKRSIYQEAILELFKGLRVRQLSTRLILDNIDIKRSTMYSTLRGLQSLEAIEISKNDGLLAIVEDKPFREFTYTLRIINTSTKKPKHRWDSDVEATVTGTIPNTWNEIDVKDFHRAELEDKMLEILGDEGILNIPISKITIKEAQTKGISGVELKDPVKKFVPRNKVEVVFVNNVGRTYVFDGGYQTKIDEF